MTVEPGLARVFLGLLAPMFVLDRPVAPGIGYRFLSQLRFSEAGCKAERRLDIFYGEEWVGLEKITR
jgi:hypothetical protein